MITLIMTLKVDDKVLITETDDFPIDVLPQITAAFWAAAKLTEEHQAHVTDCLNGDSKLTVKVEEKDEGGSSWRFVLRPQVKIEWTAVKDDPWLFWDKYALSEAWIRQNLEDMEAHPEFYDEPMTEEQLRAEVQEDHYLFQLAWEELLDELTGWMGLDEHWHCEFKNFGWRRLSGSMDFRATDGATLLREVLPKTDCAFKIWKEGPRRISIQNWHHDNATGDETYIVTPRRE
tara:strand:- start:78 stop:773 length:696 start_codon:yes stop_codon:yes gene_type:complete